MSAKYKSPSFLLPNELNTSANTANDTGINSLYSMDFNGSNYIDTGFVPANNLTLNCSISAWVNMPDISNNTSSSILGTYDFGGSRARFFLRITRVSNIYKYFFGLGSGTGHIQDSSVTISNFSSNTWVHLALTYDGADVKLYSNGTLDGTLNAGNIGSYPPITSGFDGISYIGATHRTGNVSIEAYLTGKIDEVAIFNKALSTTEIAALYDGTGSNIRPSNLIASNLNPIAYYPLGEQAQNSGYLSASGNEWQFPNGVLQDYVMDFNGNTGYISAGKEVGNSLGSSVADMSVSLWYKNTTGGNQGLFSIISSNSAGNTDPFAISYNNNSVYVWFGSTYRQYSQTFDSNWHHLAVFKNGVDPSVIASSFNCLIVAKVLELPTREPSLDMVAAVAVASSFKAFFQSPGFL